MRPSPKAAKRCRLSEGYGRGYDWPRTRDVLIDPDRTQRSLIDAPNVRPYTHDVKRESGGY